MTILRPPTLDEQFASIADRTPGFAGMYFDRNGTLVVRHTGAALESIRIAFAAVDVSWELEDAFGPWDVEY